MATPQLSPGVLVREVDLTVGRVDNIVDNIGAIAGPFTKGPVEDPVTISNEQELIDTFGKPSDVDNQYEYWMTAASYLSYGGILKVVRTDGDTIVNSSARTQVIGEAITLSVNSGSEDDARTLVSQSFTLGEIGYGNTTGYGYTANPENVGSGLIFTVGLGTTGTVESIDVVNPGTGYTAGVSTFTINGGEFESGIYLVTISNEYRTVTKRIAIKN